MDINDLMYENDDVIENPLTEGQRDDNQQQQDDS